MLKVIVWGKFSPGLNCPDDISVGSGVFPRRWSQISWRYLNNDQKLNTKKSFLTESEEQH